MKIRFRLWFIRTFFTWFIDCYLMKNDDRITYKDLLKNYSLIKSEDSNKTNQRNTLSKYISTEGDHLTMTHPRRELIKWIVIFTADEIYFEN